MPGPDSAIWGSAGSAVGGIIGSGLNAIGSALRGGPGFANSRVFRRFASQLGPALRGAQAGTVTQLPGTRPAQTPPINPNAPPTQPINQAGVLPWIAPWAILSGIQVAGDWWNRKAAEEARAAAEAERKAEKEEAKRERQEEKDAELKRQAQRDLERADDRAWQSEQRAWQRMEHEREVRAQIERDAREQEAKDEKQRKIDQAPLEEIRVDPFLGPLADPYPGIPYQVLGKVASAPPLPPAGPSTWYGKAAKFAIANPSLVLLGLGGISTLVKSSHARKTKPTSSLSPFESPSQGLTYDYSPMLSSWPQTEPATSSKCKPCKCKKPKKRGPRKARSVCYKGSYTETATGLRKHKRTRVPC